MRRREFVTFLWSTLAAWPRGVQAQTTKIHRIGFLRVGAPPERFLAGFRQGLRELGYLERQNLAIEFGLAGTALQLADVAAELVRQKVDVLVTSGSTSVPAAMKATNTIPIVFVGAFDPVEAGVVASLARPGGNVTGLTHMHADLMGRRLQLLKDVLPSLATIAVLARSANPNTPVYVKEAEAAAQALGLELQIADARESRSLAEAFDVSRGSGALLVLADEEFTQQRSLIAELALKNRLPTIFGLREIVEAGGLMSYGPDYGDLWRRAASHVHKILQGAKPSNLPVEQPTKFEFVVNLRTAKALDLTMPPTIMLRADEVIE